MAPVLTFTLLGRHFAVASYSTMMYLAAAVIFCLGLIITQRRGLPRGRVFVCLLAMAAAVPIGSRIMYVLSHLEGYMTDPALVLEPGFSSFALFGGLLLATFTGIVVSRRLNLDIVRLADSMAAPLGIGLAVMKTGCFLAGCCCGVKTDLPWGVVFPRGSDAHLHQIADGIGLFGGQVTAVHPSQLYEAVAALLGACVALWMLSRQKSDGSAFLAFGLWFCSFRLLNYSLTYQPPTLHPWLYPTVYVSVIVACLLMVARPDVLDRFRSTPKGSPLLTEA